MADRRDRFDVRLLDLKDPFYDYVEKRNLNRSDVMRHFIKQGLSESGGFSFEQQQAIKAELIGLKRAHGSIGTNLNQTARYFNQYGHLVESDLAKNHADLLKNQKEITRLINMLLAKL